MVVGTTCHEPQAARLHATAERLGVGENCVGVGGKLGTQRLAKGHGLASYDVLERAALRAREDRGVNLLGDGRIVAENDAATGPAQGLVRGGGHHVSVRHRRGVTTGCHKAGDVGHVHHEGSAVVVGNLGEALEVDNARVGGGASNDELGLVLLGLCRHVIEVDALGLGVKAVGDNVVELAREVRGRTVREVAAVVEGHAHDSVARLREDGLCGVVGLGARVGLDVGVGSAKELLHAVTREVLDLVDGPAAAVVAVSRKALGVLVGERGPHGLHHGE